MKKILILLAIYASCTLLFARIPLLNEKGKKNHTNYTLGTKIDEELIWNINTYIKKEQRNRLFPMLYELLNVKYNSLICNEVHCKPLLLYIKYFLTYKNPKKGLFKEFINYIEAKIAIERENIRYNKTQGSVDINKLMRLIIINPYSKDVALLLDILIKEAIEIGSLKLIEQTAKYLKIFRIPAGNRLKKIIKFARRVYSTIKTTSNFNANSKKEESKILEVFRSGEIFTKGSLCKEENQDIDFDNLYEVLSFPSVPNPNVGQIIPNYRCFNLSSKSSLNPYFLERVCNNVSYLLYKHSKHVKINIINIFNPTASTFFTFKSSEDSFNIITQLPPPPYDSTPTEINGVARWQHSVADWVDFSKTIFTRNYIIFTGNTLDNLAVCKIHDDLLQKHNTYVNNNCFFPKNKIINYEKYYVLDINYSEDNSVLYALLAVEGNDNLFKLALHSFNVPNFSLNWISDIATYFYAPKMGESEKLPNIPKHSIIFTYKGNIIILSQNYFIGINKQTGIKSFVRILESNPVITNFTEPLIINKSINEILYLSPSTSTLYHLDIERGVILKFLDLSKTIEGEEPIVNNYTTLMVPGISKNLLVYYFHNNLSPSKKSEIMGKINAININTFKRNKKIGIPASIFLSQIFGSLTFISMGCKYMFIGTSKGILRFTSDIKKGTLLSHDVQPAELTFQNKNGLFTSLVPDYVFSYGKFLFVFSKEQMLILSSKKKV